MHEIDFITGSIIDSAMRIHTALGPGLFESVYEVVLERDLVRRGFSVERQKELGGSSSKACGSRMPSFWIC